ncbi:MAG: HDOD domain-containing protein [Deltaproteobacteria bacterium]|nr:HDOD domain-containing protein [Deltaproteobacteria bacterium]
MSDIFAEQKLFLKMGIESIFTGGAVLPAGPLIPLRGIQVDPETMDDVIARISSMQTFRTEQVRLQKMVNDPTLQLSDFSKIVLTDPVLTAKILRMANSSYFGMQQKIDSISHALMILGLQNIKNIIYREGMRQLFHAHTRQQAEVLGTLWRHSSITSVCASYLCDLFGDLNMGTLFTLGIIHDIGKLVVLELPQAKEQGDAFWGRYPLDVSIWEEDRILGINHEVVGGIALEHWNFSELMTNTIRLHHAPSYMEADQLGLTDEQLKYVVALFMADQIAKLFADWPEGIIRTYPLRESYHYLVNKNKLLAKVSDTNFLGQIREAEAIAASEQHQMAVGGEWTDGTLKTSNIKDREPSRKKSFAGDTTTIIRSATSASTIGRYEIVREIGRGARDVVYLAMDPILNREIAVKTLRYQDADERELAESKARFFSEAKAVGKLSHPNIVNVYDVGEHRGAAYIAMEFLDGTDLVPYCEKDKRLPLQDVARIVATAAHALDYAHRNGIVHRDVKPGNIRILKNGTIKVIDFGIARIVEPSKTQSGSIAGSPNYMSPEQIDGQSLDGRSDLFSLGAILYELLTGQKPFQGENFTKLFEQITTAQPIPVRDVVPDIPESCAAIIDKALAKDREQRYQSGQQFADDLLHMMENPPADLLSSGRPS